MSQYSVLMVDDEEEVYQVMMKKLNWEEMGFSIAGYARNGLEALELAEELSPDVVMTDIKMPYMDGLTLCRKLKEIFQNIKVIIFSGFDEFEYAKEAIKIEAEEYILKPINANELREVFERVRSNLDRELDEKCNIDKLRSYYLESLPVLQESFCTSLLEGRLTENQIGKYALNYQINLTGPYFVTTVMHISGGEEKDPVPIDPFLMAVSVKKLVEEQLAESGNHKTVTYLGEIVVISELESLEEINRYTDRIDIICKMAKRVCSARVTAGIGHVCNSLSQLQLSYQGAKNAVAYRVMYGHSKAINIAEIDPQESADMPWEDQFIQQILQKIKLGDRTELEASIAKFTGRLTNSKMSIQKFRLLIMELIAELFRFGTENSLNMDLVFGEDKDVYSQALQLETPESIGTWLAANCGKMQQMLLAERQDNRNDFVKRAVEYVRENYADKELGIETVCMHLNVSASYFSTIFKKETGKTFINYLTDYRMQKAVDLLVVKNEKTYIIADAVGYADPNYFSYVFKKQFGMSPSKYKMQKQEET